AALPAVAAVGSALRHVLLAPEMDGAVTAAAGGDMDPGSVVEHRTNGSLLISLTESTIISSMPDRVTAVRAFNRFYTNEIGVLREGLLGTPYSLTEARVLYELGQVDRIGVSELRRGLDIDRGYLSRILARLEDGGLSRAPRPDRVVLRGPAAGDFGWVIGRHGALYAEEYGWDASFESLVARIVADYVDAHDPRREAAWVAEVDGERAGCIFCVRK